MPPASRLRPARLGVEHLEDRTVPSAGLEAPGRVLVSFADGANTAAHETTLERVPVAESVTALGFGMYRVDLDPGVSVAAATSLFAGQPGVERVGADAVVTSAAVANDPQTGSQWALDTISAPQAWNAGTGTGQTIVAVIDTGVDTSHPDLVANLWRNPDASAPDRYGYDFVNNDADPSDDNGHGTAVAGVIGAVGNNGVGVTGVAWKTRIMALKFMDANGNGFTSDAIRAMDYAVQRGAKVLNNSWAGAAADPLLAQAIARARANGAIVVVAAGNESSNNDTAPTYPANYVLSADNVVVVAATNQNDQLSSYSNYGAQSVTLAAPGDSILTTARGGGYTYKSGTSLATPFVSGAIALFRDEHPDWDHLQVIAKLKQSVDTLGSLSGKVSGGGRLDLAKFLDAPAVSPPVSPPVIVSPPVSPPAAVVSPPVRPPAATNGGPRVLSATFSGSAANTFDRVRVTFNQTVSAPSFTGGDVVLTGPNGARVAVTGVSAVSTVYGNSSVYDVTFARQSAAGTYRAVVGPEIWNTTAKRMDQNANGTSDASDTYAATGTLSGTVSPPATSPPVSPPPTAATSRTVAAVGVPIAIPDLRTTRVFLTVTDDIRVSDLRLTLNISHARPADLYIRLVAPDGRRIVVFNRRPLSLANVTFDDAAGKKLDTVTALSGGAGVKPEQALTAFDGASARGTWTVEIFDLFAGSSGTVRGASLSVVGR